MQAAALAAYPVWSDLACFLVAPMRAAADGWGHPDAWLALRGDRLRPRATQPDRRWLTKRRSQRSVAEPRTWESGPREGEVLRTAWRGPVQQARSPPDSPVSRRAPIEKHVESLLRKTGTRSRRPS